MAWARKIGLYRPLPLSRSREQSIDRRQAIRGRTRAVAAIGIALVSIVPMGRHARASAPLTNYLRSLVSPYTATVQLARVGPFGTPGAPAATVPAIVTVQNTGVAMPHLIISIDTAGSWVPKAVTATVTGLSASVTPRSLATGPSTYTWDFGGLPAGARATVSLGVVPTNSADLSFRLSTYGDLDRAGLPDPGSIIKGSGTSVMTAGHY